MISKIRERDRKQPDNPKPWFASADQPPEELQETNHLIDRK
ncbi:hypothetical protein [Planctopirus ephydatiae]|jgi:hypothetical protein|nr:hypothetical protein [Planctopirus ephydatiae]